MISTEQSDFKVEESFTSGRLVKGADGRIFKDIVIQTPTTPRMIGNLDQKFGKGYISPQAYNRPFTPMNMSDNCMTTYTQAAKASLRKDPNFEFFTMTLISQKM